MSLRLQHSFTSCYLRAEHGTKLQSVRRPRLFEEARRSGTKVHVGALMIIVSIKGHEKHPSEWVVKARIVFRGDAVRDEDNQAAVFDEIAASAPTSLARFKSCQCLWAFGWKSNHNQRLCSSLCSISFVVFSTTFCFASE